MVTCFNQKKNLMYVAGVEANLVRYEPNNSNKAFPRNHGIKKET